MTTTAARRRRSAAALALATAMLITGCAPGALPSADTGRVKVVTTTDLIADLVTQVGGDRVEVVSLVPPGGDPHSYDPSLRDVRDVVYADVAFTNYLMLEEQRLITAIDTNLPTTAASVRLAEESVKYAANLIPLVEDASLDTVWLGFRAEGGAQVPRTARVELVATGLEAPGDLFAYLTGSFGELEHYFDSTDGLRGDVDDTVTLPPDAHTHLSWAFSEPGIYTLSLEARLRLEPTAEAEAIATGDLVIAVGVDPHSVPSRPDAIVIDSGHADLSVDLANNQLHLLHDREASSRQDVAGRDHLPLDRVVIAVPNTALQEVPGDPRYRFLGNPGNRIHQLAQAVLGKHVHGEIDPHLWHDPKNAAAYVQVIRDTLIRVDPSNAAHYTRSADAYLEVLDALDTEVRGMLDQIPASQRTLITTHDSFGYLAAAYDFTIAGFVTPNPAVEPSLAQRRRLVDTIRNLEVPAVFLEPGLAGRSSVLGDVAASEGVRVCPILGDSFAGEVESYVEFMRFNARSLVDCLGGADS